MKNKRGVVPAIALVLAVALGLILLVVFAGGGISTAWNVSKFISDIPSPILVIFGLFLLFKILGRKK